MFVLAVVLAVLSGLVRPTLAAESWWQSSAGRMPTAIWPPWEMLSGGSLVPVAGVSNSVLRIDGARGAGWLFFQQRGALLTMDGPFVIEAALRCESASGSGVNTACAVHWTCAPTVGNTLCFRPNQIFLMAPGDSVGVSAALDTSTGFHTYRIEVDGDGVESPVRVYRDGALVLNGANYSSSEWQGTERNIWWGDGTSASDGVSEWRSIQHGALSGLPVANGRILFGFSGRRRAMINQGNGNALFLSTDSAVPYSPNDYVLTLTSRPSDGAILGLVNPDTAPQLLRVDPFSATSVNGAFVQTDDHAIISAEGMAFDPVSTQLFMSVNTADNRAYYSPNIATVDPETGRAVIVGAVHTVQDDVDSMGFANGWMYALDVDTVNTPIYSHLYRVNTSTWQAALVGSILGTCHGLTYNPVDGQFYSTEYTQLQLLRINPSNAVAQVVGKTHESTNQGGALLATVLVNLVDQTTLDISLSNGSALVWWPSYSGLSYQLFSSTDLKNWSLESAAVFGTGALLSRPFPLGTHPAKFFRVDVLNQ